MLLHTYFSDRERGGKKYTAIRDQISRLFTTDQTRATPVWFVGVWDTVSSVGAPLLSRTITASPTIVGKRFNHVRQALALDEYRCSFEPRPYFVDPAHDYAATGQSIAQLWFAGAHCDVGRGYSRAESRLSQEPLLWMLQKAVSCQPRLRAGLLDAAGQFDTQAVLGALAYSVAAGSLPHQAPRARVHSETWPTALWALAGLQQRNSHVVLDAGKPQEVVPVEHPSVAAFGLTFPADTVWARRRPLTGLFVALVLAAMFWLLAAGRWLAAGFYRPRPHGAVGMPAGAGPKLQPCGPDNRRQPCIGALADWLAVFHGLPFDDVAAVSRPCGGRHLGGLQPDRRLCLPAEPRCDLGLCPHRPPAARQPQTFSCPESAGHGRHGRGGKRRAGEPADTGAGVGLPWPLLAGVEPLLGLAMTAAALSKWAGLLGCGVLVLWGLAARPR